MRGIPFSTAICFLVAFAWAQGDDQKKDANFHSLDLQPKANSKTGEQFAGLDDGEGQLMIGEQTLEGVKFKIGAKYMQLGGKNQPNGPAKLSGIKVDHKAVKLHLLHATGWSTAVGTIIGEYVVTWEDDTTVTIPMRYGKDILDWWYDDTSSEPTEAKVAWKGVSKKSLESNKRLRLYLASWENPKPDKKIKTIDFTTTKMTECSPFCVAITVESK